MSASTPPPSSSSQPETTPNGSTPKRSGPTSAASHQSRPRQARPNAIGSTEAGTDKPTRRSTTIMLSRMRYDPRTRAYIERRQAEDKTTGEICRMLRRYIAREVYKHLPRTTG